MGLDQYLYATKNKDKIQLGYWRKEYKLNSKIHEIWDIQGRPGNKPESYFNEIPVVLSLKNIENLIELTSNYELYEYLDNKDFFYGKTLAIFEVAIELLTIGWEVYYISDY